MKIKNIKKIHKPLKQSVVYLRIVEDELHMRVRFKDEVFGDVISLNGTSVEEAKEKAIKKGVNTLYLLEQLGVKGYETYVLSFYKSLNPNTTEGSNFEEIEIPRGLSYPVYFITS